MTLQSEVDGIQTRIIKSREDHIAALKKKRAAIDVQIEDAEEYLEAYKKTVPTVMAMEMAQ